MTSLKLNPKTARKTSSFPCRCLLFAKLLSAVPSYSDETNFTKYPHRFSTSVQRVDFIDTLRGIVCTIPLFMEKSEPIVEKNE